MNEYIYVYTCICTITYIHVFISPYSSLSRTGVPKGAPRRRRRQEWFMIWHRCIYICIYIYIDICHEQVCLKVRQDTGVVEYYLRHSYVCHDSFMCDMMHSYVWHDSFICVTWLIHICDTSMRHVRQLYICLLNYIYVYSYCHTQVFLKVRQDAGVDEEYLIAVTTEYLRSLR